VSQKLWQSRMDCVAVLKLRCAGRERCCPGRRQRQPRFSNLDWPKKSNPHHRMEPKIPSQGVGTCTFCPGPGTCCYLRHVYVTNSNSCSKCTTATVTGVVVHVKRNVFSHLRNTDCYRTNSRAEHSTSIVHDSLLSTFHNTQTHTHM